MQQLDDAGAERFLKILQQSAKRKQLLELAGVDALEKLLAEAAVTGTAAHPQCWLLQLELLQRAGLQVREEPGADDGDRFDLVLVLPPRQRDEARALLARAVASAAPGGRVVACQVRLVVKCVARRLARMPM